MIPILIAVSLLQGGTTSCGVRIPEAAAPEVEYAAQEFTNAIWRISGAKMPVARGGAAGSPCVRIEAGNTEGTDERLEYVVENGDLVIRGNMPRAALHATYLFLQRELGVRWYFPDPEGEIYPKRERLELKEGLRHVQTPSIRYRGFHHCSDWYRRSDILPFGARNFVNVHRAGVKKHERKFGYWNQLAFHNAYLGDVKGLFEAHPEYFSEQGGKRMKGNICFSSDGAVEEVSRKLADYIRRYEGLEILSIFPADNQNYCRCEKCRAKSVSTGWFGFYMKCIARLRAEFPKVRFVTSAYQGYRDVPDCPISDTEFIDLATHDRCSFHPYADAALCPPTAADLRRMEAWARTGLPMGQYNYEYDVFLKNFRYLPVFGLIDDIVDTAVRFKQVSICSELYMTPRFGPDERCCWLQNRLSVAWYGQKMFDASLKWEPWLREATGNLYGPAGDGVFRFLTGFERTWRGMRNHINILHNSLSQSAALLPDDTARELAAALADAEGALAGCNGEEKARYAKNLRRVRALWEQWLDGREECLGRFRPVEVPMVEKEPETGMELAWRSKDIGYRLRRGERLFVRRPPAGAEAVELGPADTDEVFRYTRDGDGKWRMEDCGDWIAVDLKPLPHAPLTDEHWKLTVVSGGRRETRKIRFSTVSHTAHPVLWWLGRPEKLARSIPSFREGAARGGFEANICTNAADYLSAAESAKAIYVNSPQKTFTPACGAATLKALKAGATVYFAGYVRYDLGQVLGDPSLASEMYGGNPRASLAERHATWVRDGDWQMKPHKIKGSLLHGTTPMYPKCGKGDGWAVLAKMKAADGAERPFLSARRVGKGVLILAGGEMDIPALQLMENVRGLFDQTEGELK